MAVRSIVLCIGISFTHVELTGAHSITRTQKKSSLESVLVQVKREQIKTAGVDSGARNARVPRYAKVNGDIETLWQPPRGNNVSGILFVAHGCMHQATDFFYGGKDGHILDCSQSNFGTCLALPEERQLVEEARERGLYVMAVSGGSGKQSCWDFSLDGARVKQALDHVISKEGLHSDVPIYATGASSGGAFMAPLALELRGYSLRCVVPQISALAGSHGIVEDFAKLGVPTLFVHMPVHDPDTADRVASDMRKLQKSKVRVHDLRVEPVRVMDELSVHYTPEQAKAIESALQSGELVQDGYLISNPRQSNWRTAPGMKSLQKDLADSFVADESKLVEILNVAWAQHEFTARYAKQMLDFCDGRSI